jgi:hypothetical protein
VWVGSDGSVSDESGSVDGGVRRMCAEGKRIRRHPKQERASDQNENAQTKQAAVSCGSWMRHLPRGQLSLRCMHAARHSNHTVCVVQAAMGASPWWLAPLLDPL